MWALTASKLVGGKCDLHAQVSFADSILDELQRMHEEPSFGSVWGDGLGGSPLDQACKLSRLAGEL